MTDNKAENLPSRADLTRERILAAAEETFAKRGLSGTRVREIAVAAGVNGATLYTYYPSKQLLYEAVLEQGMRPVFELLEEFSAGPGGVEAAEELLAAVIRHLSARPSLPRLIYLETISEGSYLPHLARRWLRPLIERVVAQMKTTSGGVVWEESLLPLVATGFMNIAFGHFALAPLFREVFDVEPLSEEWVDRQTRFMARLIELMFQTNAE